MSSEKIDPATGKMTTGHEWNGIEELDSPVPRVVLFFLFVTTLFSIIYWVLMPAWPLGVSYTKGLLGIDQRDIVTRQVEDAAAQRAAAWTDRLTATTYEEALADTALMSQVNKAGRTLFVDNCAVCHGVNATGGPGFPDLTAKAWIWGGEPEQIEETLRVGINSTTDDTRISQMLAFGRDGMLDRQQILNVVSYVRSLSADPAETFDAEHLAAGKEIFAANCASCHGADAKGMRDVGAPDLTDKHWIYGGSSQAVYESVHAGRQGHMPHWAGRLSNIDLKVLTLYVSSLGNVAK